MTLDRDESYLVGLVRELCKLPAETTWVEFKENNSDPAEIGEYLSALSNAAALDGKSNAYLLWGISNNGHEVVGTQFDPHAARKGNEELESWLLRSLSPRLHFRFHRLMVDDKPVVILEIPRATGRPTQFEGREFIRIGSYKKPLKDFPDQERSLWRIFDLTPFEAQLAATQLSANEALALLDYPAYFDLRNLPLPTDQAGILARLSDEAMLVRNQAGSWDITNLGAILFAKDLHRFKSLSRKAVRVIVYEGKGRLKTLREQESYKGYACGFQDLIDYISALLPRNEVVGKAIRKDVPMYPDLAVRELVANALIHQDFSITGMGPTVEVFADRMEITNPGVPLVSTARFLDSPPRSRNESLASFMRLVGICEERGSGVDKVVFETEFYQLPAPRFETEGHATRVMLFAHRALKDMDRNDRVHACYMHACLRCVEQDPMTNASLRERFGIEAHNSAIASRIIRDSLEAQQIKPYDPAQGNRNARYLPWWA
ncbi:ATP-binding protein [Ectopseudomonas khazarica]|uniref:ATP-binding protein n=1 Tax=Ectopseudomonas khazarica TaxID=2502979 RepID=UPI003A943AB3